MIIFFMILSLIRSLSLFMKQQTASIPCKGIESNVIYIYRYLPIEIQLFSPNLKLFLTLFSQQMNREKLNNNISSKSCKWVVYIFSISELQMKNTKIEKNCISRLHNNNIKFSYDKWWLPYSLLLIDFFFSISLLCEDGCLLELWQQLFIMSRT